MNQQTIVIEAEISEEVVSRRTYEVVCAVDSDDEQKQLRELVARVHPDSKPVSTTDDASMFRSDQGQIVARYLRPTAAPAAPTPRGQEALFSS